MAKDYAKPFYNSKAWQKTQAAYMASKYYVCENCGGVAHLVHHITPITPVNIVNPVITLHWNNLQALCIDCHNTVHMVGAICAKGLRFNSRGDLIQINPPCPDENNTTPADRSRTRENPY